MARRKKGLSLLIKLRITPDAFVFPGRLMAGRPPLQVRNPGPNPGRGTKSAAELLLQPDPSLSPRISCLVSINAFQYSKTRGNLPELRL